jgi:precorrin-6B methylase 1
MFLFETRDGRIDNHRNAQPWKFLAWQPAKPCSHDLLAALAIPSVGDPCLSSGLKGLLRALEGFRMEIIPGISSIQLAAALARVNIDESVAISFHSFGNPEDKKQFMLDSWRRQRRLIVIGQSRLDARTYG